MEKKKKTKRFALATKYTSLPILLLYLTISVLYVLLPQWRHVVYALDDYKFHMNRIIGLENIWHSPVNFNTFNFTGIPVNLFYPWLTSYPLYILTTKWGWITGYNAFIMCLTFITLIISHLSMYRLSQNKDKSILFAILYSTATYRAIDIFFRAALGEMIALAFFPIVLAGNIELITSVVKKEKIKWQYLALGMTLLIYTHVLSVFIATLLVLSYTLFTFIKWRRIDKRVLVGLVKAATCTLVIGLAFIGPLLEQTLYQGLNEPLAVNLEYRSLDLGTLLVDSMNNQYTTFNIGLSMIVCLFILSFNYRQLTEDNRLLFILGTLSFLLTTKLFPWELFQHTPIHIIQFPWRLFTLTTLLIAWVTSNFAVDYLTGLSTHKKWGVIVVLSCCLLLQNGIQLDLAVGTLSETTPYFVRYEDWESDFNQFNTKDYAPKVSKITAEQIKNHQVMLDNQPIDSHMEVTPSSIVFEFNAKTQGEVSIPLYRYKGTRLWLNNKEIRLSDETKGIIRFKLASRNNKLLVKMDYTVFARICQFVSLSASLICLGITMKKRSL